MFMPFAQPYAYGNFKSDIYVSYIHHTCCKM